MDDYDEEGGQLGWSEPDEHDQDNHWRCLFPGGCVMGASIHSKRECVHLDDAAHFYDMANVEFSNTETGE